MKTPFIYPALALLATLSLCSCKPTVKSLLAVDSLVPESLFSENEDIMKAEAQELIHHYLRTQDARATSPAHKLTMLHLAAFTHRYWLVEKLLAEGADPNAQALVHEQDEQGITHAVPGPTPAYLAVKAGQQRANKDALWVVRALVNAGADLNRTGKGILSACNRSWRFTELSDDALAVELIRLGARADDADATDIIAHNRDKALTALLATPEGKELVEEELAHLLYWAAVCFDGEEAELTCPRNLLQHFPTLPEWEAEEHTPLFILAKYHLQKKFTRDDHERIRDRYAAFMALMLQHGENPLRPDGEFRRSCAADYIAASPEMTKLLSERGYNISAPAHHFAAETLVEQLLDIPSAAISDAEVREQFDTLAGIFSSPTEAMFTTNLLYRQACRKALTLIARADAGRAEKVLLQHPAWRDTTVWEGEAHHGRGLLVALRENAGQYKLPADFLCESARLMDEAGRPGVAHAWRLLLADNPENDACIEKLCADDQPLPVRAAAMSCRLRRAGLPSLGTVGEWDSAGSRYVYSTNEPAQLALRVERSMYRLNKLHLLEKPESFFYESGDSPFRMEPDKDERAKSIAALREIGAPLAARLCGDTEPLEPAAGIAELEQRYGRAIAASIELELALALHIEANREAFEHPNADYVTKPHPGIK